MPTCQDCAGTTIEYSHSAGNGFCVQCGTLVEENTIVNEVSFGENTSGAAIVQGSYVGAGATRAKMSTPFGQRTSLESREHTLLVASRKIKQIAGVLHIPEHLSQKATRYYSLAVETRFTKGRKSIFVIASCLYCVCREGRNSVMLIDFSDLLQVNVFELGHTYLSLLRALSLSLPLIDPSIYISRFASLLEFGSATPQISLDATRLCSRFSRDWLLAGRRPSGICGASLYIASRMNGFSRSISEIVQVVKIGDETLRRRLREFEKTQSAELSVEMWRGGVWIESEGDPPAFRRAREREERERLLREGVYRGEKRRVEDGDGDEDEDDISPLFLPDQDSDEEEIPTSTNTPNIQLRSKDLRVAASALPPLSAEEASLERGLEGEIRGFIDAEAEEGGMSLRNDEPSPPPDHGASENSPPSTSNQPSQNPNPNPNPTPPNADESLSNPDIDIDIDAYDDELDLLILSPEEVKIKERVWMALNRDYLLSIALRTEKGDTHKPRKRRKTQTALRHETSASASAGESVRNLVKKTSKFSKRINYKVIEGSDWKDSTSSRRICERYGSSILIPCMKSCMSTTAVSSTSKSEFRSLVFQLANFTRRSQPSDARNPRRKLLSSREGLSGVIPQLNIRHICQRWGCPCH